MMRWLLYLLLYIPVQLVTYLITPLLPLFAVVRYGKIDNANGYGLSVRLPEWLAWFDTPDNPISGDSNWIVSHFDKSAYWSRVAWLYRNSLYGFKWSVLAMPIQSTRKMIGNPQIDYHSKTYGTMRITQPNGAWQYKSVRPFLGKILVLNFGWLLDDTSQERALFMFSPRVK
jgi:hypothetical protein